MQKYLPNVYNQIIFCLSLVALSCVWYFILNDKLGDNISDYYRQEARKLEVCHVLSISLD